MRRISFLILFFGVMRVAYSQNIGINTTGAAANSLNMLEILQISTTANSVGRYTSSSGNIAGTGYGLKSLITGTSTTNVAGYFSATGATNNYAGIFENGYVGIGTATPSQQLHMTASFRKDFTASSTGTSAWMLVSNDGFGNIHQYINTLGGLASPLAITEGAGYDVYTNLGTVAGLSNSLIYRYSNPVAAGAALSWKNYMVLDAVNNNLGLMSSTGNVGVGTTSPTLNTTNGTVIHVNNANASYAAIAHFTNGTTGAAAANGMITGMWTDNNAYVWNYTNSAMIFGTNSAERMRISAGGDVGIGVSPSGSYKLEVNGHLKTTAINETSDIRLKKNILTIDNALAKVQQLRGVTYDWRADEYKDRGLDTTAQIGLIAQEVEKVFPQLVGTDAAGFKSVEYSKMVAVLIEAIKDQQKIIDNQKAEINSLNGNLNDMQRDITSLRTSFELLIRQGIPVANK